MQLVRSWKQLQMPVSHCGPCTFCAFSCFCATSTSSILFIHPGGGAGRIGRVRPTDALELQTPTGALPTKLVVPFPSPRRGASSRRVDSPSPFRLPMSAKVNTAHNAGVT